MWTSGFCRIPTDLWKVLVIHQTLEKCFIEFVRSFLSAVLEIPSSLRFQDCLQYPLGHSKMAFSGIHQGHQRFFLNPLILSKGLSESRIRPSKGIFSDSIRTRQDFSRIQQVLQRFSWIRHLFERFFSNPSSLPRNISRVPAELPRISPEFITTDHQGFSRIHCSSIEFPESISSLKRFFFQNGVHLKKLSQNPLEFRLALFWKLSGPLCVSSIHHHLALLDMVIDILKGKYSDQSLHITTFLMVYFS